MKGAVGTAIPGIYLRVRRERARAIARALGGLRDELVREWRRTLRAAGLRGRLA